MTIDHTNRQTGQLITLEGTEGVGKSTNIQFIEDWLRQQQLDVVVTREPGGTPIAEAIRETLLKHWDEPLQPHTELLLIMAARVQHVNQVIFPALSVGKWVLCDRFMDATYAYQGGGRQLSMAAIASLEQFCLPDLQPDLTILLDAPIAIGRKRAEIRGEQDRFEAERLQFFERVRQTYLARTAQYPQRFQLIDASLPLHQVQTNIVAKLAAHIALWRNK